MINKIYLPIILISAALAGNASAQYPLWTYSNSLHILTTPEGANIPASVTENGFPLLVRLDKDFFTFSQAKTSGEDIRFSTPSGSVLPYQIEDWDAANGKASIWVRIPTITGNSRQAIKMYWGNADANSESNGAAVFDTSSGFNGVWHLNDVNSIADATARNNVGTNKGTTNIGGLIGKATNFVAKNGQHISLPVGSLKGVSGNATFSFWAYGSSFITKMNTVAFGAVNDSGHELIGIFLPVTAWSGDDSPATQWDFGDNIPRWSVNSLSKKSIDSNFSGKWRHWAFTHNATTGTMRIYLDGIEWHSGQGMTKTLGVPASVNLGFSAYSGWWGWNYDGYMDEFQIANTERSAAWNRLSFENQKPLQTLAGILVPAGSTFSVPQSQISVLEGQDTTITAIAGGAQKTYWILKTGATETIVAVDRLRFNFSAFRVTRDTAITLQFKAIYPSEIKTQDITITIKEDRPDPVFTLTAPATWNGRNAIDVVAQVSNQAAMDAKGVGTLNSAWEISNIAASKTITPGKMTLTRSQGSGKMTVTLSISNGGTPVTRSVTISVTEPSNEAWVARTPAANEKPENSAFYARDDKGTCTIYYKGTLTNTPDSVYLNVYAGATLYKRLSQTLAAGAYNFSPTIDPGLVQYKLELGSKTGNSETVLNTVANVVCGDAYIIEGQSNAEATQFGTDDNPTTSEWIRTYGSMGNAPGSGWYTAAHLNQGQVGYWGLELARILVTNHKIPICIINGAVGGTRIDQHQRNELNTTDTTTIYGRLLTRIQRAKLTHGMRGVLWHQGESDQGSEIGTGRMDWETYQQFFIDMSANWKSDYPNLKNYYLYQIVPAACGSMIGGSESILREMQRQLPYLYSNMSIMSTLGIRPLSTCHFAAAGYQQFANLMAPLVERDNYGKIPTASITPPDIKKAYYTSTSKSAIALQWDQPVKWSASLTNRFYLDGVGGKVTAGVVSGNVLTLTLSAPSSATKITYLDSRNNWGSSTDHDNIIWGMNNIAALTFWDVPVFPDSSVPTGVQPVRRGNAYANINTIMQNGVLHVMLGRLVGQALVVELVNLQGQLVLGKSVSSAETVSGQITMPYLHQGVYILKVRSIGEKTLVKKFTVF